MGRGRPRSVLGGGGRARTRQRASLQRGPVRASQGAQRGRAAGACRRVRRTGVLRGAATLYAGHPPGWGERRKPPRAPDVLGAGQRRDRAKRGAVVQAPQREGPGKGRGAEVAGGQGRGLAGEDPQGVGADSEPGAGAGGPGRADRRAQLGRSAGRSAPGRRPEAGGGVEPGAERPSWPGAVQDEPGRGVGDGEAGGARRAEERGGPERAGRRQPESGAAKAGDRRGRGAAEGDL